ncbi:hypothetical protein CYLTODRAFT_486943 [Cylindrobasidium torrendii FP15055 ss-10]|uniref:Uncharacterized protein n=1 Tax=Cylindrobasidium torrendii FP15055 ss-10 TaxID=1314674 RepID=A0A0D7BQF5_9AGAR|nr:hypothetical protein CYLTODRAFT_486943 [Cylindrobasidium torrendii FP15055 ss-10]
MAATSKSLKDYFKPLDLHDPVYMLFSYHGVHSGTQAFITHLDRAPVKEKILTFMFPFALNLSFVLILLWRGFSSTSHFDVWSLWLQDNTPAKTGTRELSLPWYFATLLFDVAIFVSLPYHISNFIKGELWMRIQCGFKPVEIIFRKPTGILRAQIDSLPEEEFQKAWFGCMMQACDADFLRSNVGYNTRFGFWVLDYAASPDAYRLVQDGAVDIERFDIAVWQKTDEQWTSWEISREAEKYSDPDIQRRTTQIVVDRLRAMGKEELLKKWAEMVRNLQTKEEPTSEEKLKQQKAMEKVFADEGVNFVEFWQMAMDEAVTDGK